MKGDSGFKGEKARHYYDANLKRLYCALLISASATYLKRPRLAMQTSGADCASSPAPNPHLRTPPAPLSESGGGERRRSARGFHFDSVRPMNMYKLSNTIFLMVIGLLPARARKQMVITLPSSRCWKRAALLNMTTAINALIINRLAWVSTEVSWAATESKPLAAFIPPEASNHLIPYHTWWMMIKFKQTYCRRNIDLTHLHP